jgi:hypothetical protein
MEKNFIERLISELEKLSRDRGVLEFSLEKIISQAPRDFGMLLRACAIPHWFDSTIIGVFRASHPNR